ncbi:hypothetical protein AOLI_G00242720 [Acnodon oligacanthus]
MTAMELRERKRNPEEEAAYFSSACKDKDGFDVKYIKPDTDDSLGRLVNDDHVRPNSKMKTITVAGKPHLCLFATRSFTPGEEITYNYGDSEWPWRCKNIAETDALVSANSVLAKKNQMQPEELLPQVPRDATHKVPEEGPFASPMMVTLPPVKERAQIKSEADVLVTTIPLLTEKDQMQPEELHPQFSREATHENISDQRTCMWHVTTVSQILNLKNSELDQVADFLGHDIRVHREYYRLPEATTQLAKISKLLLAMEKGCLPDLQGKSLDDTEIEDEINSTDDSDGSEPENAAMDDAMTVPRQTGCEVISFADTEPEAPTVTTQTFMDEVDTPTVHPLGNKSHEDADVEVEAEDRNTLTDTQLDDTKATFSQTLAEIETLKKDTPEIETRKHQEKKKTRRGTRGKGRKIYYKKKGEQVM